MDIKNYIVSEQSCFINSDCFSNILTWYRNGVTLYRYDVLYIWGALASFIQGKVGIGISSLAIGFLFSPYGLPMIGATVISFIKLINEKIKAVQKNQNFGGHFLRIYENKEKLKAEIQKAFQKYILEFGTIP